VDGWTVLTASPTTPEQVAALETALTITVTLTGLGLAILVALLVRGRRRP
jgi:hypothetical protein